MYIMYSLLCCGTGKRIHNIDNLGVWESAVLWAQANVYII